MKIKVGLLGMGNVKTGTYKTSDINREKIFDSTGLDIEITKVLVNDTSKDRGIKLPAKTAITNEYNKIKTGKPEANIAKEAVRNLVRVTRDRDVIERARGEAEAVIAADPQLREHRALAAAIAQRLDEEAQA